MTAKPSFLEIGPYGWGALPIVLPEEQDHTHPEKYYKELILGKDSKFTAEQEKLALTPAPGDPPDHYGRAVVELCRNCGWHSTWEKSGGYASRVKVFHVRSGMALWSIGSKWLLRDQPNDGWLGNDYMTQKFLREQPNLNIPLVDEMHLLSGPSDRNQYTLMSRAQGSPLPNVWHGLSGEQKQRIRDQLTDALRQLRQFTAPAPQRVDGSPMQDGFIADWFQKIPPTMGEWFDSAADNVRAGLRREFQTDDPILLDKMLQVIKDGLPRGDPYVLTHRDLSPCNIIVDETGIVAIIDWEYSGYLPWWMERMVTDNNSACRELFEGIWEKLCPEMDHETFSYEIAAHVRQVSQLWALAPKRRGANQDAWHRRAWCECKPFAGTFIGRDLGHPPNYTLVHEPLDPREGGPKITMEEVEAAEQMSMERRANKDKRSPDVDRLGDTLAPRGLE